MRILGCNFTVLYNSNFTKYFITTWYTEQPCQDDLNWRDTKYGNGEDTCATMTEKMCNTPWNYGEYSAEARRACPRACRVCSGGSSSSAGSAGSSI